MPVAPSSSRSEVFVILPAGVMFVGSVTLRIWTPPIFRAATATYIVPSDSNVVMPVAPSSAKSGMSVVLPRGRKLCGSETSKIWTPSSKNAATAAYILSPDLNMVTPVAPSSSRPVGSEVGSVIVSVGRIFNGSVISRSWMPSSRYAVTTAYM